MHRVLEKDGQKDLFPLLPRKVSKTRQFLKLIEPTIENLVCILHVDLLESIKLLAGLFNNSLGLIGNKRVLSNHLLNLLLDVDIRVL